MTAITDNAALTCLVSLITGLSDQAKTMLMAGAVAGGGLTVIANAPNPAGAHCCGADSTMNRSVHSVCCWARQHRLPSLRRCSWCEA